MANQETGYSVYVADKFIGRSRPVIIACYNTSSLHHWVGRWIVVTDDFIQCTFSRDCNVRSDGDHTLTDFVLPEWMSEELLVQAEGLFNQELQSKHHELWKDLYNSAHPPKFVKLDGDEAKSQIFRLAFFGETVARGILKHFGTRCGNEDVAKWIKAGENFKVATGL
jgi:hypothetical protein